MVNLAEEGGPSDPSAEAWVDWTVRRFGDRAVFASSFGAEDMVLLHMIAQAEGRRPCGLRVFTIDTGRLFPETYDLIQTARDTYGIPIDVYSPDHTEVEDLVSRGGPNLFYASVENRKACCGVRKVHPLGRALQGARAWMVGVRREQSPDRATSEKMARDPLHGDIWKISPLADWSWGDVLGYVKKHEVPISSLHARGFPSVGCAPCTRAVRPGEDPRGGRWWWEIGSKECGLHPSLAAPSLHGASAGPSQASPTPSAAVSVSRSAGLGRFLGRPAARDVLIL